MLNDFVPYKRHTQQNMFTKQDCVCRNFRKSTFRRTPNEDSDQPVHSCSLIRTLTGSILDSKDVKFLHVDNEDW